MEQWLKVGMLKKVINIFGVFITMLFLEIIQKVRLG